MTLAREIALRALKKLHLHNLTIKEQIGESLEVQSVTNPSAGVYRVNFLTGTDLSFAFIGMVFYIFGGPNMGYHVINAIGDTYIDTELLSVQASPAGEATFFTLDIATVEALFEVARNAAELYTNNSFGSVKDFVEYRNGTGSQTLILQRKKIRSLIEIKPASGSFFPNQIPSILVSDVDESYALDRGILQIKPNVNTNIFSQLRYFPKGKIQITGTYGYAEDEIPENVKRSLEFITASVMLVEDISQNGNASQFSIEQYSQTNELGRDVQAFSSIGKALLTSYCTGVAGS